MGWPGNLIKSLAIIITPIRLAGKVIQYAEGEVKDEAVKLKLMVGIISMVLMFLIFLSVTLALLIGYFSNNYFLGFSLITAIYLLVSVVLIIIYRQY